MVIIFYFFCAAVFFISLSAYVLYVAREYNSRPLISREISFLSVLDVLMMVLLCSLIWEFVLLFFLLKIFITSIIDPHKKNRITLKDFILRLLL